jgi:hypothetical protein
VATSSPTTGSTCAVIVHMHRHQRQFCVIVRYYRAITDG